MFNRYIHLWLMYPGSGRPNTYESYGSGCGSASGTLIHLHHSSKIKRQKKSQISTNKGVFLTIFAWSWWMDLEPDPNLWLTDPYLDPDGPTLLTRMRGSLTKHNEWLGVYITGHRRVRDISPRRKHQGGGKRLHRLLVKYPRISWE
jgi:hypothetical protein